MPLTGENPVASVKEGEGGLLLLAPLNTTSIWRMGEAILPAPVDFDSASIAKNPAASGKDRPVFSSVYFGVPPKSAASVISLGATGSDVDRFVSATSFHETSYGASFGFFGFDKDSLSAGVSRKFAGNTVTSLYYNGNIVEDIFAYIANNSLTNGAVGLGASDGADGSNYDFMGDLKDRNNINSRTNIDLMFGTGIFGVTVGYSQKLFGLVKRSNATPEVDGTTYKINDTQEALLDNALVPHVEFGFHFDTSAVSIRTALAFQMDIHQRRELSRGDAYQMDFSPTPAVSAVSKDSIAQKLSADYLEPAVTFRIEADFPGERSRLGLGLESGARMRMYSNMDDRAGSVSGVYWSENKPGEITSATADSQFTYSVTAMDFEMEVLARPSVRYLTRMGPRFKTGLNAGFGVGFNFGTQETKTYQIQKTGGTYNAAYMAFLASDDPYTDADLYNPASDPNSSLKPVVTTMPSLDLGLYPSLGVGFSYEVAPGVFVLNGGIGGTQTLYRLRTGEVESVIPAAISGSGADEKVKTPLFEQSWGKPLAQFALGATFMFKEHFALDAMFSSNGTAFDDTNFVVQFTARF